MKAQAAIEFSSAYAWAFLLIILAASFLYYYMFVMQKPGQQCDFGNGFSCRNYKFFNNTGDMKLTVQLINGVGRDISFYKRTQTVTVNNIGKNGVNSYNGTCFSQSEVTGRGDIVVCTFDITDRESVPSFGQNSKFDISLSYSPCDTDPLYPARCNGNNKTLHGSIATPYEIHSSYYCMDGICSSGEGYKTCPWDCGPRVASSVNLYLPTNPCANNNFVLGSPIPLTVKVKDQNNIPMENATVYITAIDYPELNCSPYNCSSQACSVYAIIPNPVVTDSSGTAFTNFTMHSCSLKCCRSGILLYDLIGITYEAISNTECMAVFCESRCS